MTFKSCAFSLAATFVLGVLGAGCGNYSNEDLEFMNAVPDQTDLAANLPVRSALATGTEAELAKDTHDTVKIFNGILDSVLGDVEAIRAVQPTGRGPDSRTWGPFPDTNPLQTAWEWQFAMQREADGSAAMSSISYRLWKTVRFAKRP